MKYATGTAALVAAFSFSAHAQDIFIVRDLAVSGDGAITYNTISRLEWLDVLRTEMVPYGNVRYTTYAVTMGFRHANLTEVQELLAHFGVDYRESNYEFVEANHAPIRRMIDSCVLCNRRLHKHEVA